MFDAAAGFGGYKQSGYGRDGGQEGLWEYMKPNWYPKITIKAENYDISKFGAVYNAGKPAVNGFQVRFSRIYFYNRLRRDNI